MVILWKLDLEYTGFEENFGFKDTLQKVRATVFDFWYQSPIEIADNLAGTFGEGARS